MFHVGILERLRKLNLEFGGEIVELEWKVKDKGKILQKRF